MTSRIPPLVIVAIAMALMWLTASALPMATLEIPGAQFLAMGLTVAGATIAGSGVLEFRRAKTTVDPLHPERASRIVRTGIYRFSRNPMYLGFAVLLVAWAVFLENPLSLLWVLAFVAYMNHFQIALEEAALRVRFAHEFEVYVDAVRRWL